VDTTDGATARRLFVVSETLRGGIGAVVRSQAAWFIDHGWRVVVAAPADGDAPAGVTYVELPAVPSARAIGSVRACARVLREAWRTQVGSDAVVHVHGMRILFVTRAARLPKPFVTVHGAHRSHDDPAGYAIVRRAFRRVVPMLAARAFTVEPGYGPGWTYQMHAGPALATTGALPFPSAGVPAVFGWIGLLDERKQPEVFVRALATVARDGVAAQGLLAGDGPRATEIKALIDELGAPVTMLGFAEPTEVLRGSWALCLFSRSEGTPLAVVEAMWAGRSVIASSLPGTLELMGGTGTFADDVEGAARAIGELAGDYALAQSRGVAAAARIRTLVDVDAPWPATLLAYEQRGRR
jgi:glycosyltransferase involved in cell wall biosynthesis